VRRQGDLQGALPIFQRAGGLSAANHIQKVASLRQKEIIAFETRRWSIFLFGAIQVDLP
jgi:hypothetical protein